jgi:Rod binding domain-containing protein
MGGYELISQGVAALQNAKAVPEIPGQADPAKARKVALDFEAVFLGQMLQPVFSGVDSAPPFGGGHAEKVWRSLMVDEIGKAIVEQGGIGLADHVQTAILQAQEVQ